MTAAIDIDIRWRARHGAGQAAFSLGPGVTALIGPSGAGKTTLARMIAGLATPVSGSITTDRRTLFDKNAAKCLPPEARQIGYVPQDSALFPHMDVRANIDFGARASKRDIDGYIEAAGIAELLERQPHTLSGGEARRVAIVRALAAAPALLILDEPMTGLDPKRRRDLMRLVRTAARAAGIPVLLITHQVEEMLSCADHAVLMKNSVTVVAGPIESVLEHPETAALLDIDDAGALLSVTVGKRAHGLIEAALGDTNIFLPDDGEPVGASLRLRILARDVAIALARPSGLSIVNQIECTLDAIRKNGGGYALSLSPRGAGQTLISRITEKSFHDLALEEGMTVFALVKAVAVKELQLESGAPKNGGGS